VVAPGKPLGRGGPGPRGTPPVPAAGPRVSRLSLSLLIGVWTALAFTLTPKLFPVWRDIAQNVGRIPAGATPFAVPAFVRAAVGHALALLWLAPMLLAALGAGAPLARILRAPAPGWPGVGLSLACGWGMLSLANQGLGLAGLWQPGVLGAEACVAALAGAWVLARNRSWSGWERPGPEARLPVALSLVLLAAYALLVRMPDTHEDARVYHLAAPETYLLLHRIVAEPLHFVWHMPLGAEMLFALPYRFGGLEAAKLVNLGVLATCLLLLHGLVRTLNGAAPAGWWAGFWFLAAGLVADECWQGKNDLVVTMHLLCAAWAVAEAAAGRRRFALVVATFCGFALGIKWTAGLTALGMGAALVWWGRGWLPLIRLYALAGWGMLPALGWWLQSWLFVGNPIHPFLSSIFPELAWGPAYQEALHRYVLILRPPEVGLTRDLLLGLSRIPGSLGSGAPALLALMPLGLGLVRGRAAAALKAALAVTYLAWLVTERNGRYLFPLLPVLAAFCAVGAARAKGKAAAGLRWLAAVTCAGTLFMSGQFIENGSLRYLAGQISRDAYLRDVFSTWDEVRVWANTNTPPTAKLWYAGEQRRLWLTRRTMSTDTVGVNPFHQLATESRSPAEMRKRIKQMGLTHVVYNLVSAEFRTLRYYPGPEWSVRAQLLYAEFCRQYEIPVYAPPRIDYQNGGFYVFALTPRPVNQPWAWWLIGAERLTGAALVTSDANRHEEALKMLMALPKPVFESGYAQSLLGVFYNRMGRYADAYRVLNVVLARGLADSLNLAEYGRAALFTGRLDEAEAVNRRALDFYPDQIDVCRLNLGVVMIQKAQVVLRQGRWAQIPLLCDEADRWFNLMRPSSFAQYGATLTQNRATILGIRGLAAHHDRRDGDARKYFQQAIDLNPNQEAAGIWRASLKQLTPQTSGGVLPQ